MEEGRFISWLKKEGQWVEAGTPLFEMEGEKAIQEIESLAAGFLRIADDAPEPNSTVNVGRLLGYLLEKTTDDNPPKGTVSPSSEQTERPKSDSQAINAIQEPAASTTKVTENTVAGRDKRHRSSPRARRLAQRLGIDIRSIQGSGRGGRIREADVQAARPQSVGFTPRRKAIAERLRRSVSNTIPVTLHTTLDVTQWVRYREQQKSFKSSFVPSYTDLFALVIARVLPNHPSLCVRWNEKHTDLVRIAPEAIGVGIAVDTTDGLLVPVISSISRLTLEELVQESRRLIAKGREGRLTTADMDGGTITLSNLGAYGIDRFTPILNYPEVTILGLGAIRTEPVFVRDTNAPDGRRLEARERMTLSLTFDHAALDGAPAAAFLKDLVDAIENVRP
jgi:pyruvate dehydrogenase E2 component (dihydrolipoamide acetyltransferase)